MIRGGRDRSKGEQWSKKILYTYSKHLKFLCYTVYNLCSYFMVMAYVVYLTMLTYVPLLCSFLVLLDHVCIIFSTLVPLLDLVSLMQ